MPTAVRFNLNNYLNVSHIYIIIGDVHLLCIAILFLGSVIDHSGAIIFFRQLFMNT